MPASASVGEHPLRPPSGLSDEELREWLAVACELDRTRIQLAARPTTLERVSLSVLQNVIPLAPHLPGRIGKWSRGILKGTNLLRGVYDAMFN